MNRVLISKKKREIVFNKLDGHCYYCGKKLKRKYFIVEHIKSVIRGGSNKLENLAPACQDCNTYKGCLNVEEFRNKIYDIPDKNRLTKLFFKFHSMKRKSIKFYFEEH